MECRLCVYEHLEQKKCIYLLSNRCLRYIVIAILTRRYHTTCSAFTIQTEAKLLTSSTFARFFATKNLVRIGGWILCHESLSFLAQSLTKNPSVLDPGSHRQGDMLRLYNPDGSQTIDFLHLRPIFCNKKPRANRWLDCNQRSLGCIPWCVLEAHNKSTSASRALPHLFERG